MYLFAMIALCLLRLSPLFSGRPRAVDDYTAAGYDYFVDDRTPTVELLGKQSHSTFSVLSCTMHCYCCCYDYNHIQLHSLFLSPLDEFAFILCNLLYLYHSAVNPTHC